MKNLKKKDGIALILALIMLLITSILAISVSFTSNIDFQTMSNYKRGQEAFLAAERCVEETRKQFETVGIETLYFQIQGEGSFGVESGKGDFPALPNGATCRTGRRNFNRSSGSDPAPSFPIPLSQKTFGRALKHTSLPSGGIGGAVLFPVSFTVTGKDAGDKDKDDTNPDINTGTEISAGLENFIPGGASNVY